MIHMGAINYFVGSLFPFPFLFLKYFRQRRPGHFTKPALTGFITTYRHNFNKWASFSNRMPLYLP